MRARKLASSSKRDGFDDGTSTGAKVRTAATVFNGFGKTIGLMQITELGQMETPILLTNTLNVGRVADALVAFMLERNPAIGVTHVLRAKC